MPLLLTLMALLALPLAEIAVFIAVGSQIGVGWTLLLIVVATIGGIALVRRQSFSTLQSARAEARSGRVPERQIVHGAMIVLAGLLLILPGFITDVFGLLLLLPPVRDGLWQALRSRVVVQTSYAGGRRPGPVVHPSVVDLEGDEFSRRGRTDPDSPWREIEGEAGRNGPRDPNERG